MHFLSTFSLLCTFSWHLPCNKASGTVQSFLLLHADIFPEPVQTLDDALHLFSTPESLKGYRTTSGKLIHTPMEHSDAKPLGQLVNWAAVASRKPQQVVVEAEHPQRPGEPDCSYYVKFGSCKFGISCIYNHPARQEHPLRPGEPDCTFFLRFASCKFGMNCRFNHPPRDMVHFTEKACNCDHDGGKTQVEQPKLNSFGLPLRPGAGVCSYYMNRGTCKFSTSCKFHHPEPESEHERWHGLWSAIQGLEPESESEHDSSQRVYPHSEQNGYQLGDPYFEPIKRVRYTRDQLLEMREASSSSSSFGSSLSRSSFPTLTL